jgi:hypothetical protein
MKWIALVALLGVVPVPVAAVEDTTPPTVVSARVVYDPTDPEETALVEFVFSEPVEWFAAVLYSNYIDTNTGETSFQGFWYPPDRTQVRFEDQLFGFGTCEEIRVVNVKDLAGNAIVDDGVGNVFRFYLTQVLVNGNMRDHMKAHDAPPHSFALEGVLSAPGYYACTVPMEDVDGDSTYSKQVFFNAPCSTATGGAQSRNVPFRFSHLCAEMEPILNRTLTLDLAAHPDGRDTLDLDWANEVVTGVEELPADGRDGSRLEAVFPNPARTATSVAFSLSAPARVALDVVDVGGRVVRRLAGESWPAGPTSWIGTAGRPMGAGWPRASTSSGSTRARGARPGGWSSPAERRPGSAPGRTESRAGQERPQGRPRRVLDGFSIDR